MSSSAIQFPWVCVCCVFAFCGAGASTRAHAGEPAVDGPNLETAQADGTGLATDRLAQVSNPSGGDAVSAHFAGWFARVKQAQDSQPHWITPIATVTPRLEEEFRYDQDWQTLGSGATVENFDGGKGLELIPTRSNEIIINLPPYEERRVKKPATGFGDWPFLLVKQRLASGNEQNGNYIVSAFLGVQAPTGIAAYTNDAWVITPTLAAGKGWGNFDVQGTVGVPIPLSHESTIGIAVVSNVSFQYHIGTYFWPEIEVNTTYWANGERGGKTQVFLTPGLVLGRFPLAGRLKGIVGVGYQVSVSPKSQSSPITPQYDHAWILSTRVTF